MKKVILAVLVIIFTTSITEVKAQNWDEWFRQKQTQKKYLIQQIAGLKVYASYAKKGYSIAKDGLRNIGGFTKGEFDLHRDYLNSLKVVNPEVKHYEKINGLYDYQIRILEERRSTYAKLSASPLFTAEELLYVRGVYDQVLEDCERNLEELKAITSDFNLEMTDNQRVERIDRLYYDMQDNYLFAKNFGNEATGLALARKRELQDVKNSRALHGIK